MRREYTVQTVTISSGSYPLRLLILRPTVSAQPKANTPGILWIHGGGYVTGMAGMIHMSRAADLTRKYGAVVVTPEYRLAGQAPYPAALQDCHAALTYLHDHAEELGANPAKLMVGGESAGGGLAVAVCMYARDHGTVSIAFQMPLYPMIDDRDTDSSRNNWRLPWNTFFNRRAWRKYLAGVAGEPPAYAAPARQRNYAGLPPCYTFTGRKEPFYCETLAYVENLKKAGVPAQADVYPTGFHAFDMLTPWRKISREAIRAFERQYQNAAEGRKT